MRTAALAALILVLFVSQHASASEFDWHDDPAWEGDGHPEQAHWSDFSDEPELGMIVYCESGFNPTAKNKYSSASGLGQLLDLHAPKFAAHGWDYAVDRFDPISNRVITEELYHRQGVTPWLPSKGCWQ